MKRTSIPRFTLKKKNQRVETLPCVKQIANGNLQYDSGNSNRSSESTLRGGMGGRWEGGSRGKGYMYTYG